MPRPIKEAIAFFYFDIGFWSDDKITDLVFDFGVISELVYIHMISIIYSQSYFCASTKERMAKRILTTFNGDHNLTYPEVVKIIEKMADVDLLDKGMLENGIFTSKGIQKQYYASTIRRKEREHKFWLLTDEDEAEIDIRVIGKPKKELSGVIADINSNSNELLYTETPVNVDDNQQNKNKKKNKKKKEIDKEDKYDKRNYPGPLEYFTSCLINDKVIDIYNKDIEKFNELFNDVERKYPDLVLRQRVFRYVEDYIKRSRTPIDDLFNYFYVAFTDNLDKMEGYDERMQQWYDECQAILKGICK